MRALQGFMRRGLKPFIKGEEGLVTVEWVALASAVVIGGIALAYIVMESLAPTAKGIGDGISTANTAGATAFNTNVGGP